MPPEKISGEFALSDKLPEDGPYGTSSYFVPVGGFFYLKIDKPPKLCYNWPILL